MRFFSRGVHPELDPSVASLPQDDRGEGLPQDDKGKKDSLKIKGAWLLQNDKKRRPHSEGRLVIANVAMTLQGHGGEAKASQLHAFLPDADGDKAR
ncbi:MAG: hypothetical protein MUO97_01045 [Dehalococcoidia bacterium]|nr:hypothetical protein [Dehalococcoidia bacterium]